MLEKIYRDINGITITAQVVAGLAHQVKSLLATLPETLSEKECHDYIFSFGMFFFKLKKQTAKCYTVLTPDWLKNPLIDWTTDLSLAFALLSRQVAFMKHAQIPPQDLRFDQKVVCDVRAFGSEAIYLQRQTPDISDSGWYVGVADDQHAPDYRAIYVFELFEYFPYVIDYLALPENYLLIFHKNILVDILDGDNQTAVF